LTHGATKNIFGEPQIRFPVSGGFGNLDISAQCARAPKDIGRVSGNVRKPETGNRHTEPNMPNIAEHLGWRYIMAV
jgi:hypothetical protein